MDKFSVLMSVYIREKPLYLRQSINSLLNQTVKPDEIVIVKDGPLSKELDDVIQDYVSNYPNLFTIVTSENNMGLGLALNLGLKYCRNELVARMDSDDISLPDRCEKQLKVFQLDHRLDILGGNIAEFIDVESNIIGKRIVPSDDREIKKYIKKRCPFNHMTVMFKKTSVLRAGNYQECFFNEDYYLWIRMLEAGCKFGNIPDILVNVRVSQEMYKRRGGKKYFKSELFIQRYMLEKRIINLSRFFYNVFIRFVIQVIIPNNLRGYIIRKFARSHI